MPNKGCVQGSVVDLGASEGNFRGRFSVEKRSKGNLGEFEASAGSTC